VWSGRRLPSSRVRAGPVPGRTPVCRRPAGAKSPRRGPAPRRDARRAARRTDPGLRNAGLLATQELKAGVPQRADWRPATDRGKRMLALRGRPLLEALGFCVETLSTTTTALTARVSRRAVALLLDEGEGFEEPGRALQSHRPRFAGSRRSRTPRTPRGHPHPQSSGPALLGSPGRRRRTPGAAPKPTSKSTSRCCLTTQPATCRCCWAPTRWLMVARSSRSSPAPPTSP